MVSSRFTSFLVSSSISSVESKTLADFKTDSGLDRSILGVLLDNFDRCPLCLAEPPLVPRLTSCCRQVFCLPCLLKLRQKLDHSICPVCGKQLYWSCMVIYRHENTIQPGDHVILELFGRASNGEKAVPISQVANNAIDSQWPEWTDSSCTIRSPIYTWNSTSYQNHLVVELETLNQLVNDDPEDASWYQLAIEELMLTSRSQQERDQLQIPLSQAQPSQTQSHQAQSNQAQPVYFRFYQPAQGFHVFLSLSDIRTLVAKYGSYDSLPPTLSFTVDRIAHVTLGPYLASRARYLGHLPQGAEITILYSAEAEDLETIPTQELKAKPPPANPRENIKTGSTSHDVYLDYSDSGSALYDFNIFQLSHKRARRTARDT